MIQCTHEYTQVNSKNIDKILAQKKRNLSF